MGFKEKLIKHIKIEKEMVSLIKINQEYMRINGDILFVYNWLSNNNYNIDKNLVELTHEVKKRLMNVDNEIKNKRQLCDELKEELRSVKNFRYVISDLCSEENISLEQLGEKIGADKSSFINSFNKGIINKENYIKLCNYFELDIYYPAFIKYCEEFKNEIVKDMEYERVWLNEGRTIYEN